MTTRNMKTRPKNKRLSRSSSSVKTARLKIPTDVLALGQHLVTELNLDERGDTLSRWLAHHVAELINQARTLPPGRERSEAQKQATETILKIWAHRGNLPHHAYPLAPFKDLLKILTLLQPNNNPYRFSHLSRIDQLAAVLFDRLTRLTILLLLTHVSNEDANKTSRAAVKAMTDEEQGVLNRLNDWFGLLLVPAKTAKTKAASKKPPRSSRSEAKAFNKSMIEFIDDSTKALADLRNELNKNLSSKKPELENNSED
jgi:hypothetical protein